MTRRQSESRSLPTIARRSLGISLVGLAAIVALACSGSSDTASDTSPTSVAPSATETDPSPEPTEVVLLPREPAMSSQFPVVDGAIELPEGAMRDRIEWFLGAVAAGTVSDAEIDTNLAIYIVENLGRDQWKAFIEGVGSATTGDVAVVDVRTYTTFSTVFFIGDPGGGLSRRVEMNLDIRPPFRINRLGVSPNPFRAPVATAPTASQQALEALAPGVGLLVADVEGGTCDPIHEVNGDEQRAIGSIVKLYILKAVADAIARGEITAETEVVIEAESINPIGHSNAQIQAGTVVTVGELAELMIGYTDNTATDQLHRLVGREAVEAAVAALGHSQSELLRPFVNTNELFHFRWSFSNDQIDEYLTLGEADRRAWVEANVEPLGAVVIRRAMTTDYLLDVTWFASPRDICEALIGLRSTEDPAARALINRAMSTDSAVQGLRSPFDHVWYKGGSEAAPAPAKFGVYTGAWYLEDDDGTDYVIVSLLNDSDYGIDGVDGYRANAAAVLWAAREASQ